MNSVRQEKRPASAKTKRRDGLMLVLLGAVVFTLFGLALENAAHEPMVDFRVLYYPARCLLNHGDPYNQAQVLSLYRTMGGDKPTDSDKVRQIVTRYIYLPTSFSLSLPLALLPWGPAHFIWLSLTIGLLIFAAFLTWSLAAEHSPVFAGALVCLFLVNSELLVISTNAAGIVVSLCAAGAWCLVRNCYVLAGILCLAVAVAVKPQDAGLIWLYFLLARAPFRKRILLLLLATVVVCLPAVGWVLYTAPHWLSGWQSNMAALSVRGGISDPGPTSSGGHGLAMVISLQAFLSVIRDDPPFYNLGSELICAPLILVWGFITSRKQASVPRAWLALASIAALSMLPVYHRQYDAKLLLLTVPACAMLWAEGGLVGWAAMLINTAAFVLTGDLTWAIVLGVVNRLHLSTSGRGGTIVTALQVFPAPLILLLTGIFYLWVYIRRSSNTKAEEIGIEY